MLFLLRYSGEYALDLATCVKQSTPQTPILLLYTTESDTAERLLNEQANKKGVKISAVPISGQAPLAEEKTARKYIAKAMAEVMRTF